MNKHWGILDFFVEIAKYIEDSLMKMTKGSTNPRLEDLFQEHVNSRPKGREDTNGKCQSIIVVKVHFYGKGVVNKCIIVP